jgi:hypothetical protein
MGGDFDHMSLHLQLSIDCIFVEPQHMVVIKKFLPKFKYDKSKVEEYQLALTISVGNLWVTDSIGHLGANGLANLLQQCVGATTKSIFGSKPSRRNFKKKHCQKPWFDTECRTMKHELKLWLKANPNSHVVKHQKNKLKKLLKRKIMFWETTRTQHMCVFSF